MLKDILALRGLRANSGGGDTGGGSGGGEMTDVGADIYVVFGGQLLTFGEFLATMQGAPVEQGKLFDYQCLTFVRDELPKIENENGNIFVLGVTKQDGQLYINQEGWYNATEMLGIPSHGWIDKTALEGLDLTSDANAGFYAVQNVSYPFIDGTLTDLVSSSKRICPLYGFIGLTTVNLPNVLAIPRDAFLNMNTLESINIPKVEIIDVAAFQSCTNLTSIVLPVSLKMITSMAFRQCVSLSSITFEGTVAQWNTIAKDKNWNYGVPATEVVCSDGTVSLV